MKRTFLLALALTASLFTNLEPASSHSRCKIKGPMGTWTYVPCPPHNHTRFDTGGGPSPKKTYNFKIINTDSSDTISYYMWGKKYRLRPGYHRKHSTKYKKIYLYFDRVADSGSFERYNWNFNADTHDLKIWRDGKYIRVREVLD